MADGIDGARGHQEATGHVVDAQGPYRAGEHPITTAARRVVRDHERDPVDGTVRTFGGRDEGRLINAVQRIGPSVTDGAAIEGALKADVAIQRMGAKRLKDLESGVKGASQFDRRDRDAVHGDVTGIATEASRFSAGALASGRFEQAHVDMRTWIRNSVGFAAREAQANEARSHGVGANMARISSFMVPRGTTPVAGASTGAKGPERLDLVSAAVARDIGTKGR